MRADVHRFGLADPGDVSGLRAAIDAGSVDPASIVAVIGKTHGNGLVNDYTRGYLAQSLSWLIGERLGESAEAVRARIPLVFSGGVEGVLSPHYTVFTAASGGTPTEAALAVGVGFTAPMREPDIGRQAQIDAVAQAVSVARIAAGIAAEDVHFVQVKGPAPNAELMRQGRAAGALGVAVALGELDAGQASEATLLRDFAKFSAVASISAGIETRRNEVVVLGMSRQWSGPLAIGHCALADALDVAGVHGLLRQLGFPPAAQVAAPGRVRAAFVKCEASRDGLVRGRPHTMLVDGDIDQQRHIQAAVGAIVAGILGDTALFVSGGAEHQGPDGGGLVAIIAERVA